MPYPATHAASRLTTRIALVQMRCSDMRDENLARASRLIEQAAEQNAQLVCLPELFLGEYFCQSENPANFDRAEPIPGPSTNALNQLAKRLNLVILSSLFERRAPGLYHNTAVLHDASGQIAGIYRKMHIPDDPLYYEKYYFTPGDLGFHAFPTSAGKVGTLVCWDQWYPEAARLTALAGADVLCYPTAIGWHPAEKDEFGSAQRDAWQTIQRAHAIANGVFVAVINRVGHEGPPHGGLQFWGSSFVADPFGRILAQASTDQEELLIADCHLPLIEETRRNWPFLRDRRIDAYGPITRRMLDSSS
jgi:N-carbamoylputrescine amidase